MIKLFRNIRQRMLSENKFSKYLLYAIGEIALVMIGILLALSINNANDAGKKRKKELTLLMEMSSNLRMDTEDLEYNITGSDERIKANEIILKALQERIPMHDSLKPHYGNIFGNFRLTENTGAWETLKSVGIDMVSNDSLRNHISQLYSVKYKYLESLEMGVDDKYQWNTFYPQFHDLINLDQLWVSAEPLDHEALMDNRKFKETLKMNLFVRHYLRGQYSDVHKVVNSLQSDIATHIETLKDS